MPTAADLLNRQYLEMRSRVVGLAADFDRLQRAAGGEGVQSDPKLLALRDCIAEVLSTGPGRAERVQMILSDQTPVAER